MIKELHKDCIDGIVEILKSCKQCVCDGYGLGQSVLTDAGQKTIAAIYEMPLYDLQNKSKATVLVFDGQSLSAAVLRN